MMKRNDGKYNRPSRLQFMAAALAWLQVLLPIGLRADVPNAVTIRQEQGGVRILFRGVVGQHATLQSSTDLSGSNWTSLAGQVVGTNGVAEFSDASITNTPRRFFRVAASNDVSLFLGAIGNEDESFAFQLNKTNTAAFVTQLPARGQLFQFDGSVISNVPARISDTNGFVRFRAAPNENGSNYAALGYVVEELDGSLHAGEATLHVAPVPDPPEGDFDSVYTPEDTPVIIPLTFRDPDLAHEGDHIQLYIFDPVPCVNATDLDCAGFLYQVENDDQTRGAIITEFNTPVTNPRGLVMFVPKPDFHGGTVFVRRIVDSYGLEALASVFLGTLQVNDPPVAFSHTVRARNSERLTLAVAHFADIDPGDITRLRYRFLTLPETGRLLSGTYEPITTNQWFDYPAQLEWFYELPDVPTNDCAALVATGTNMASYTYIVMDPAGATATATDRVDIIDFNIPPTASAPFAVTNREDVSLEYAISNAPIVINMNERDGERVYLFITQLPQHGRLYFQHRDETWGYVTHTNFQLLDYFYDGEQMRVFYVPDPDFSTDGGAPDSFSFRVMDWSLNEWRCQPTVLLYVTNVADAPQTQTFRPATNKNQSIVFSFPAIDPDLAYGDQITAYVLPPTVGQLFQVKSDNVTPSAQITDPMGWTAVSNKERFVMFVPPMDYVGTAQLQYYFEDSYGLPSSPPPQSGGTPLFIDILDK